MFSRSRYTYDIADNPIARTEAAHFVRGEGRGWTRWIKWGVSAVILYVLIVPLLNGFTPFFRRTLSDSFIALILINFAVYVMFGLKAISAAVESIGREHQGRTWELLLLTGIDSKRVILGKWLGVMRYVQRNYLWMFMLRMGAIFWYMADRSLGYGSYRNYIEARLGDVSIDMVAFLIAACVVFIFTMLEMGLLAALGLATGAFRLTSRQGVWMAVALRIGVPVALCLGVMFFGGLLPQSPYQLRLTEDVYEFLVMAGFGLFDNGVALSSVFFDQGRMYPGFTWSLVLSGMFAALLGLITFLIVSLRVAQYAAYRNGINEPGMLFKNKPKRVFKPKPQPVAPVIQSKAQVMALTATPVSTPVIREQVQPMAKTAPGSTNIFNVTDTHRYRCHIHHYHSKLSRLVVRVYKDDRPTPAFYLMFTDVGYIDGPVNWQNVDFHTAPTDDCIALMLNGGLIDQTVADMPDARAALAEATRLYIGGTDSTRIRILAGSATLLQQLPDGIE